MSRFSSSGVKRNNERISNCTATAVSKSCDDGGGGGDDYDDYGDHDDDDMHVDTLPCLGEHQLGKACT